MNVTRRGRSSSRTSSARRSVTSADGHGPADEADDAVGRDEVRLRRERRLDRPRARRRADQGRARRDGTARFDGTSARRARAPLGTFDQAFDPVGRLTGQRYRPGGKEDVAWWRHVQYDAVGNPTRIADSARGTKDYLHNAAGQLVGVLHDGKAGRVLRLGLTRQHRLRGGRSTTPAASFAAVAQQMDRMGARAGEGAAKVD